MALLIPFAIPMLFFFNFIDFQILRNNMINSIQSSGIVELNAVFLFAENSVTCLTIPLAIRIQAWTLLVFSLISLRTTYILAVERHSVP